MLATAGRASPAIGFGENFVARHRSGRNGRCGREVPGVVGRRALFATSEGFALAGAARAQLDREVGWKISSASKWAGLRNLVLLPPLLAAVWFVHKYARELPLTDEWFYVHALRRLHDVDFGTLAGWAEALRLYPAKFNDHLVVVPFWFYAPIAELTGYDSRWAIALTVAAFAGQVWVFRAWVLRSAWAAVPVALVMFCPSHYMEFLWGWQITLTFSVVFPLAGLAVLEGTAEASAPAALVRRAALAVGWLLLGVFSSAGAAFAFLAAVVVIALKPMRLTRKVALAAGVFGVGLGVYFAFMRTGPQKLSFGVREFWDVMTALGATLWGSPVGLFEFKFDGRSAGGLAVLVCTAAALARGLVQRMAGRLALATGITLVGYLCMASIAMSRPYLGNWHVQYALPAVCGGYAIAYLVWREDRSWWARVPFFGLAALLTSCGYGYYKAITDYGRDYLRYIHSIENYQLLNLVEPGRPTPYPPQGGNDMTGRLFLFLAAHDHALFAKVPPLKPAGPLPANAKFYIDEQRVTTSALPLGRPDSKVAWLTIAVPGAPSWRVVRLRAGEQTLIAWRVHPAHVPPACVQPDETYFMAALLPHRWAPGAAAMAIEVCD